MHGLRSCECFPKERLNVSSDFHGKRMNFSPGIPTWIPFEIPKRADSYKIIDTCVVVKNRCVTCVGHITQNINNLEWSGRRDSNPRPSAPKADALPDCATPRTFSKLGRAS